jgi:rod shape-determining protein MreD
MTLLLAAIGATVAALLELTILPYIRVEGANPHPVFVFGAITAIAISLEGGLVWAFVGGLALDVLAGRPLGSTAFALIISIGGAWALSRLLSGIRPLTPIIAVATFGIVNELIQFSLIGALRNPIPLADPIASILPGAIYDTLIAAAVGPLFMAVHDRRLEEERPDW